MLGQSAHAGGQGKDTALQRAGPRQIDRGAGDKKRGQIRPAEGRAGGLGGGQVEGAVKAAT
jgi:hypothetical protein